MRKYARALAATGLGLAAMLMLAGCGNANAPLDASALDADDQKFVQFYIGNCVQGFSDFSRIDAAARVGKWKRVTDPDILRMIGPADGASGWNAWAVKDGKTRYMLAIGAREVDGKPIKFCVLIGEPNNMAATRARIIDLLKAKLHASSEDGGQRYLSYIFVKDDEALMLNFVDAEPMGMKMLNVSTIARR